MTEINERLHMKKGPDDATCAIHDWSEHDIMTKLTDRLRASHGNGGTNVCRECMQKLAKLRERLRAKP